MYCAVTGSSNTVFSDGVRVSGPSDSGSRSTSGDTGEGELDCTTLSKGIIGSNKLTA